jgi:hypothetical protein
MAPAVQSDRRGARVMNEHESGQQRPSLAVVAAGAAIGAVAIYILRTDKGRQLLDQAITLLDDFSAEAARFQKAATRAQAAVSDSWQAVKGSTMSTGGGRETVF